MPNETLTLIAHFFIGSFFVLGGGRHFFLLNPISEILANKGIPSPKLSLILVSTYQVIAGILLALDIFNPWIAYSLIVFTLAASIVMLNFWSLQGMERDMAINNWLTNIAVIGGLLLIAA